MSYTVNLIAKTSGFNCMANELFKLTFGHDLMWTDSRIREELEREPLLVNGAAVEYPHQWDVALPHLASGNGSLSFGILDLQDPVRLMALRQKMNWIVEHLDYFHVVEGLKVASELTGLPFDHDFIVDGEGGNWDDLDMEWHQLPYRPSDLVNRLCGEYNTARLWAAVCQYRDRGDAFAWYALRHHSIPWSGKTVEAALNELRLRLMANQDVKAPTGLPTRFELDRVLRDLP